MRHLLFLALGIAALPAMAAISVRDDQGNTVTLRQPAQRIITLAPHVTEMVFAAGAGDKIVGTVSFSDYPPAARAIPLVGDNRQPDIERIIALKPDLLVVWMHNTFARQLEPLRKLGIPMFYSEPNRLDDLPDTLIRLGQLLGTEQKAQQSAATLRHRLASLAAQYQQRPTVRVFYQVWDKPLYTLNGRHIVSDAIRLCGGENVFAKLPLTAPSVTVEAVLLENPEVVIAGESRMQSKSGLDLWKKYPMLSATRNDNLFAIDGDLLNRSGPRIVDGAAALCEKFEQARNHRNTIHEPRLNPGQTTGKP